MPFSRQIRSNSTSIGRDAYRPVNTLPLSVSTSSGAPNCASDPGEHPAHRPRGGPLHQPHGQAEPGVVIDRGDRLELGAVARAAPRPSRPAATAPSAGPAPTAGTPAAGARRRPGRPGPAGPAPDRSPPGSAAARRPPGPADTAADPDPTPDAARAAPPAAPRPPDPSDAGTTAADATDRPAPPARPRHSGAATMQRLPGHPDLGRHLRDRQAVLDHRQHRLIALLGHAQLPEHRPTSSARTAAENRWGEVSSINRDGVNDQPRRCQASADPDPSRISRARTQHWWAPWGSNPQPAD